MKHATMGSFLPALFGWYHWLWAFFGALLYRFPSRELIVVGVTGTNGKSSVVQMIHAILEEAGYAVASISSIRFKIVGEESPNTLKMTMPGRMMLQKFLRQAVDAGCRYAVVEVTSEGIKQYRHAFIDFDVALLTNVTPEHIESHGSFGNYLAAKLKLFDALSRAMRKRIGGRCQKKIAVVNMDDENAQHFIDFSADETYGYSIFSRYDGTSDRKIDERLCAKDIVVLPSGTKFYIKDTQFSLNLLGRFNISNALAAICVGLSQGIDLDTSRRALEKVRGVAGRMEFVMRENPTVIVDYAHTPDAMLKTYQSIRESGIMGSNSKLICVIGAAGGGRDKWKRPELGKIAAQYCDEIIITNEDPYNEDPVSIIEQIEKGLAPARNSGLKIRAHEKIPDRRKAIRRSLEIAQPRDVVVITGKGCEPWLMTKEGRVPWDDRTVVQEEFWATNH